MTIDLWKVLSLSPSHFLFLTLSFASSDSLSHSLFLGLSFSVSHSRSLFLRLSLSIFLSLSFFLYLSFSLLAPSGSSQLSHACFTPLSQEGFSYYFFLSFLSFCYNTLFLTHSYIIFESSALSLSLFTVFVLRSFYFLHTSHFLLVLNICSHTQIWPRTYTHSVSLHHFSSSLH